MSVLKLFNKETGEWDAIPALKGDPGEQGEPGADGKSAYVTTVTATLGAGGWVSDGYTDLPSQNIAVVDLTADDEGDIGLAPTCGADQVAAAAAAMLLATAQSDGYIHVIAFGTQPTIDIPIVVRVVRVG